MNLKFWQKLPKLRKQKPQTTEKKSPFKFKIPFRSNLSEEKAPVQSKNSDISIQKDLPKNPTTISTPIEIEPMITPTAPLFDPNTKFGKKDINFENFIDNNKVLKPFGGWPLQFLFYFIHECNRIFKFYDNKDIK